MNPKIPLLVLFLAAPSVSFSAILVSDPFTDGDRTNGADPSGAAWYKNSSGDSLSVVSDGVTNRLSYVTATTFDGMGMQFTPTSLAAVGDSISVGFSFRYLAAPGNHASGFRFGLFNTAEILADTGDRTDTNSGDAAAGYYTNISTGTNSNSYIRQENGNTDGFTAGTDFVLLGTANTTTHPGVNDTDLHSASLTITRTATGVSITSVVDGADLVTSSDNASAFLTFNTFAFGNGSNTGTVYLDDVVIESLPIPEPAAAALALAGGLGFLLSRRR